MGIFVKILGYVLKILPALPGLITGFESLIRGQKQGNNRWLALEQSIAGEIQLVASEVAQLAPGTSASVVSTAVAVFTKSVNDAFVKLMNDLGIFNKTQ